MQHALARRRHQRASARSLVESRHCDEPQVVVPKTYSEYTSRRVLTTSWLDGEKLSQSQADDVGGWGCQRPAWACGQGAAGREDIGRAPGLAGRPAPHALQHALHPAFPALGDCLPACLPACWDLDTKAAPYPAPELQASW